MRSNFVIVSSPNLDQDLGLGSTAKPFQAQALVTEFVVETLVGAIVPRLPRINGGGFNISVVQPLQDRSGDELWPIV